MLHFLSRLAAAVMDKTCILERKKKEGKKPKKHKRQKKERREKDASK
jgi:hypothetical protein